MRRGYGHLYTEFIRLARLAFAEALDHRGMQAVELVLVFGLLFQQSLTLDAARESNEFAS